MEAPAPGPQPRAYSLSSRPAQRDRKGGKRPSEKGGPPGRPWPRPLGPTWAGESARRACPRCRIAGTGACLGGSLRGFAAKHPHAAHLTSVFPASENSPQLGTWELRVRRPGKPPCPIPPAQTPEKTACHRVPRLSPSRILSVTLLTRFLPRHVLRNAAPSPLNAS